MLWDELTVEIRLAADEWFVRRVCEMNGALCLHEVLLSN